MSRPTRTFARTNAVASIALLCILGAVGCAMQTDPTDTDETSAELKKSSGGGKPTKGGTTSTACSSVPSPVSVAMNATVVVANDTIVGATNQFQGSCCSASNSVDKVYAITPTSSGRLRITLSNVSPETNLGLYARSSCGTYTTELACSETGVAGQGESIVFDATGGATYYAYADGFQTSSGPGTFTMTATLLPPTETVTPVAACGATPVFMGQDAKIVFAGDTTGAGADLTVPTTIGSCSTVASPAAGSDQVIAVTAAVDGTLHVSALPVSGSSWDGVLYAESSCGDATTAVACANATVGGSEALAFQVYTGVTYALIFDSVGSWSGAYSGSATLTVP